MIVHTVDTLPGAQGSAYHAAYYAQQLPAAAPPARVASNAPVAVAAAPARGALVARDPAPCSIQHGYADARGWGGVIAECGGSLVSVGSQLSAAARNNGDTRDAARRVLLRSLESDVPVVDRLLPSALMLILAALALYFVARSFKEEPYRG